MAAILKVRKVLSYKRIYDFNGGYLILYISVIYLNEFIVEVLT